MVVCLLGYFNNYAQETQSENQLFVGAGSIENSTGNLRINMQVGSAILLQTHTNGVNTTTIGFPYEILYISNTFVANQYEFSKGYYPDRVKLSWQLGANQDRITNFQVFRKEIGVASQEQLIATLASDVYEYDDYETQGGVLYEYRVKANGISSSENKEFLNFITGVGFRNPTATVTGSVTFEGGNAVKDVTVFAEAVGAENTANTSAFFSSGVFASSSLNKPVNAQNLTLQAWIAHEMKESFTYRQFQFALTNGDSYNLVTKIVPDGLNNRFVFDMFRNGNLFRNFHIDGSIPTGEVDAFGNDVYKNLNDFQDNEFYHVSIKLESGKPASVLINGREVSQAIFDNLELPDDITRPIFHDKNQNVYQPSTTATLNQMDIGISSIDGSSTMDFYMDEIRLWSRALTTAEIRRDYRRFIGGGEAGLKMYLRADEKAGDFLYDLSKTGNQQNKNHARFINNDQNYKLFSYTIPLKRQLGVFGVTDANGGYTISAIPYAGTGESFEITPSLGVHAFEPATQTLFLGKDEPVVNQVNFTDISSFNFRGRVVYNVQNVFDNLEISDPNLTTINTVRDHNYNQYLVNGTVVINKGQYYYEGGSKDENGFYTEGELKEYPVIGVGDAIILIDGNQMFDTDNQPILTNADGTFTVQVPIGNHKVEVQKDGHTFSINGRFPEEATFSFFEDQVETRYFIDITRTIVVGKVVGGKTEFEKEIGFGFNGLRSYTNFEGTENQNKQIISSVNNIGKASITFKGNINDNILDKTVVTNQETGEFRVELIPYQYSILENGISVPSNTDIKILTATETLDVRESISLQTSEFTTLDNNKFTSEPYHYIKNFKYNSPVSLTLLEQEFEKEITLDGENYDVSELSTPIYIQRQPYKINFEVSQNYINNDTAEPLVTKEYYSEGVFNITNNLEISGRSSLKKPNELNQNFYEYEFFAGVPNVFGNFEKTMSVEYILPNNVAVQLSNPEDFKSVGIIDGGKANSGVSFATIAPEVPDIILRDPPGSNSYASISRGTKISYSETKTNMGSSKSSGGLYVSLLPTWTVSAGFVSVFTDTETSLVREIDANWSKSTTNTTENTTLNTYEFNQTISTSDAIDFVGAQGDLYIGNSRNVYYGIFDDMLFTKDEPPATSGNGETIPRVPLNVKDKDGNSTTIYMSSQKDIIVAEQPTNTFFSYSQKYIIETLIPDLERLAASAETPEEVTTNIFPEKTRDFYENQANLWRKVIQENEKDKYEAKTQKNELKQQVITSINSNFGNYTESLLDLVDQNFFNNRSFDAGVGEFTSSITTTNTTTSTREVSVELSSDFKQTMGLLVNNVGLIGSTQVTRSNVDTDNFNSEQEFTSTISYTLKDNDRFNVLSVDVVNLFDGNGPVFITKGGATSCPYEEGTTSTFYTNDGYDPDVVGEGGESLSDSTNRVYKAEITVSNNTLTNIPESEPAYFILNLKNTSETQADLEFILDVDVTTLNGLETSLQTNGVSIILPFGETVEYPIEISKPSSSSVFSYENIKVFLANPCDLNITNREAYVDLNIEFKKSCSSVNISAPENNWVFNSVNAYNIDVNGNKTKNMLPITFTDFNANFNGFEKIDLQYRSVSSSNWTKLKSYYGTEELKDEGGDTDGIVIGNSDAEFTYNWDIVGDNISDGNYEIRAVSYCTDNITNTSEIVTGTVNLNAPVVFGTPKPSDGILDVGEDISVKFNEDIYQRTITNITVTGLKNQQPVEHAVSLYLDGVSEIAEIPSVILPKNAFTVQFWYNNENTTTTGTILELGEHLKIGIENGEYLTFDIAGERITTQTSNSKMVSSSYNFYSFVYQDGTNPQLLIFENGKVLQSEVLTGELDINIREKLTVGGENVQGNFHDLRLWSKPFTAAQANVAKDLTLSGRETNLVGYWKFDEGYGNSSRDYAKAKTAEVKRGWQIFPQGTSYEFANNDHLVLDKVGFVQPTNLEDITLSFWVKTTATSGTIFSNGTGTDAEFKQTNGFRNKWSINLKSDGNLELMAEDVSYDLSVNPINDNTWHHIALVVKRGGSLNSYVDAEQQTTVSSINIGGISGNKIAVGARISQVSNSEGEFDNHFTGLLDEVRLWNTARDLSQISRDRHFEVDETTDGLLLYADFNEDANNTTGPAYFHEAVNLTTGTSFAVLANGAKITHSQDSPALKPTPQFTNIPFSTVINGDEMIISPNLTEEEWATFEGQVINFMVSRLTDEHFNTQLSPVTWSALVNRQELEWFTQGQTKEINTEKTVGDSYSFTMDVINIGGSNQPFTISGIPSWMQTEATSGTVNPNATKQITFTVDKDLAMGNYIADIFLETSSGFNDRLTFSLRVLQDAPDWSANAPDFTYSMNVIGQIEIDGILSRDKYTKIGAFVNDEPRGEAYLTYDTAYDSYYTYLTIYSNDNSNNEEVTFKIWHALNGKIIASSIDGNSKIPFLNNDIQGAKSSPKIFSATNLTEQNIAFNSGWNWISFHTDDSRFNSLDNTFNGMNLVDGDQIKNGANFANFEDGIWNGSLMSLSSTKMYKVKLAEENNLRLLGTQGNEDSMIININQNWNWLPFPVHRNISLVEALAFYDPSDGDVIKDQFSFAIYDAVSGWSGTLTYLESGEGYMLRSGKAQQFSYPDANLAAKVGQKSTQAKSSNNTDFTQYSSNMNIIAEVISNVDFTKVLVYDNNDNLRGEGTIKEISDHKMSFITVFSNTIDTLHYVLADDIKEVNIQKYFTFENNAVLGDINNPIQLSAQALSVNNITIDRLNLYPNPFKDELKVDFSNEKVMIERVEIYNLLGVLLVKKQLNAAKKTTVNTTGFATGFYFIRIIDSEGKFVTKKLVRE